ncbi:type VI secretion system protein TssA [Neisseria sp. Ec49-e6-T10]|uniref:type VI secretion system protein TssA n=1 Tax=Neisseria sp. Ec49-e6-T10 TaxID=3140744 RepID=UPI003EBC435F
MDFSKWLSPISAKNPCGTDIEYDLDFLALQQALAGKTEQQYGQTVIAAEAPDWKEVCSLAEQLLTKSKDLRVMAALTQAWTALYGLPGLAAGCQFIVSSLETYWDDIFPLLYDEDDHLDPFFRINALGLFSSTEGIIKQIRDATIISNNLDHTTLSFKVAEGILSGSIKDENLYPGGKDRLLIDLKVAFDVQQGSVFSVYQAMDCLEKIDQLFEKHLGSMNKIGFDTILKPFLFIYSLICFGDIPEQEQKDVTLSHIQEQAETAHVDESSRVILKRANSDHWRKMVLKNRNDVSLVLGKVCAYFETYEPSHPAPLFINRIQRLMNLNFYDIMKDISPESMNQLEVLIGLSGDELRDEGED